MANLIIPEWFYCSEQRVEKTFTKQQTSKINIDRVIEGRENIFELYKTGLSSKKKKVVVFTDWTLNFNKDKRLIQLLKEGFHCYYYSAKGIEPIDESNIELFNTVPVHDNKVLKALQEKGIAKEEAVILDYFNRRKLLNHPYPNELKIFDISRSDFKNASIIELLNDKNIKSIHLSNEDDFEIAQEIIKRFPNITLSISASLLDFISKKDLKIKIIKITGNIWKTSLKNWDLDNLEHLDIGLNVITEDEINQITHRFLSIFSKNNKIKTFKLKCQSKNIPEISNNLNKTKNYFSSLKNLDIDLGPENNTISLQIANQAKNLTNLALYYLNENQVKKLTNKKNSLGNLKLSCANIDLNLLKSLDSIAPNLMKLSILKSSIDELSKYNPVPITSHKKLFNKLNTLKLNNFLINKDPFYKFLNLFSNVKKISLDRLPTFNSKTNIKLRPLNTIEHLNIRNLDSDVVYNILSQATNLKCLSITNYKPTREYSRLTFPYLKKLKLEHPLLGFKQNQFDIIKGSPNLVHLQVIDIDYKSKPFIQDTKLKQLETLVLTSSQDYVLPLDDITKSCPNIKKLTLKDFTLQNTINTKNSNHLNSLTYLNLEHITFDISSLYQLLNRTTQLKHLDIDNCERVNDNKKHLPEIKLHHLRSFKIDLLEGFNIDLEKMLKYSSKLSYLDIHFDDVVPFKRKQTFLHNLKYLSYCGTEQLSDEEIELLKSLKKIEVLKIEGEGSLFDEELEILKRSLPNSFIITGDTTEELIFKEKKLQLIRQNTLIPSKILDTNTKINKSKEFDIERIFYHHINSPHPARYRKYIYLPKDLEVSSQNNTLRKVASNNKNLQPFNITLSKNNPLEQWKQKKDLKQYYASSYFQISNKEWTALPSLSVNENLISLYCEDKSVSLKVAYDYERQQYLIKSDRQVQTKLSFVLHIPNIQNILNLPQKNPIQMRINYFRGFKSGKVKLEANATGIDRINAILKQKKGACRHRSFAFVYELFSKYPEIPTRLVENTCHSYVEILIKGQWYTLNLGGYPAKVNINENSDVKKVLNSSNSITAKDEPPKEDHIPESDLFPAFAPWKKESPSFESINELFKQYVLGASNKPVSSKQLWQTKTDNISTQALLLENYARRHGFEVLFIQKPEQLQVKRNTIKLCKDFMLNTLPSPSGRMHDFLQENGKRKLLIIDYSQFKTKDIVAWNSIIDEKRTCDGFKVPSNVQIIGLHDPKGKNAYDGEDFISRFDKVFKPIIKNSESLKKLKEEHFRPIKKAPLSNKKEVIIELYKSPDWESLLLGKISLTKEGLKFRPGALLNALQNGADRIILNNAPWHIKAFNDFIQRLNSLRQFHYYGNTFNLPKNLNFYHSKVTNWHAKISDSSIKLYDKPCQNHWVINNANFFLISGDYQYKDKTLVESPGLFEKHQNKILGLYITHPLSANRWSQLFDLAKQYQVKLDLSLAEGIKLPIEINKRLTIHKRDSKQLVDQQNTNLIISDKPQQTAKNLAKNDNTLCVCLSELEASDLLDSISTMHDKQALSMKFKRITSDVYERLISGKNVILYGKLSIEIAEKLASIFSGYLYANGKRIPITGQVTLITDSKKHINYVTPKQITNVIVENTLPLSSTKTIDTNISFSEKNSLDPRINETFHQRRLEAVYNQLSMRPYIFISGPTGVGKSTFMAKAFKQSNTYHGLDKIKNWAEDSDTKPKVLIIDEANLGTTDLSVFESLMNHKPSIYYKGKYHPLSKNHKVVFAGNPMSYGGERKMPSLFKHHGLNDVRFGEMPASTLYHDVIKPILSKRYNTDGQIRLTQIFLGIFNHIKQLAGNKAWITPRELTMISSLMLTPQINNNNIYNYAWYYAYMIGKQCLPRKLHKEFDKTYNKIKNSIRPLNTIVENSFTFVPGHNEIVGYLNILTSIRSQKMSGIAPLESLNGLILEGPSGVGKSHLIKAILKTMGLEDSVVHIPAAINLEDKNRRLLKAFHDGKIVIMDEINTQIMSERLLNSLLMGKDLQGNRAKIKGFTLIGTQNPISLSGRRGMSIALKRRMLNCHFKGYSFDEMVEILKTKGVSDKIANELTHQYTKAKAFAKNNHKSTLPTFRDLLKEAIKEEKIHHKLLTEQETKLTSKLKNAIKQTEIKFETKSIVPNSGNHNPMSFFSVYHTNPYSENNRSRKRVKISSGFDDLNIDGLLSQIESHLELSGETITYGTFNFFLIQELSVLLQDYFKAPVPYEPNGNYIKNKAWSHFINTFENIRNKDPATQEDISQFLAFDI